MLVQQSADGIVTSLLFRRLFGGVAGAVLVVMISLESELHNSWNFMFICGGYLELLIDL